MPDAVARVGRYSGGFTVGDTTNVASAGPSRRQVLRGLAWSAPAITMVSAAPALAASTPQPAGGTIPISELAVDCYSLWNHNNGGKPGPLGWAGGHVGWWWSPSGMTSGTFSYAVLLTIPGGQTSTVDSGTVTLASGQQKKWGQQFFLGQPLAPGKYSITLVITAKGGSRSDTASVTI